MAIYKSLLSAIGLTSIATSAFASFSPELNSQIATAFNVSVDNINTLQQSTNLSVIDASIWTNPLGDGTVDVTGWDDNTKVTFFKEVRAGINDSVNTGPSKRVQGSQSPVARAQVTAAIAKAKAQRDTSNRRRLLQCNSGSKTSCTICATICGTAWLSASAVCGGAALAAEAASAGGLTPAIATALAGCLGVAASAYAGCIVKYVG